MSRQKPPHQNETNFQGLLGGFLNDFWPNKTEGGIARILEKGMGGKRNSPVPARAIIL